MKTALERVLELEDEKDALRTLIADKDKEIEALKACRSLEAVKMMEAEEWREVSRKLHKSLGSHFDLNEYEKEALEAYETLKAKESR